VCDCFPSREIGGLGESCTLTYGVNQRRNRKQYCFFPLGEQPCAVIWAVLWQGRMWDCIQSILPRDGSALSWVSCTIRGSILHNETTVWNKDHHPSHASQVSHFLLFCWFLSHSISLGVDHRYFSALSLSSGCLSSPSPLSFFYAKSHLSSLCFSVVFVQSRASSQPACCMQKDLIGTFVVLTVKEYFLQCLHSVKR